MAKLRILVEEPLYTECCGKLGDFERLDEHLRGITWAIARNAEACPFIPGTDVRMIVTDTYGGYPGIRVCFRIVDDDNLSLMYLEPLEKPDEEDDDADEEAEK